MSAPQSHMAPNQHQHQHQQQQQQQAPPQSYNQGYQNSVAPMQQQNSYYGQVRRILIFPLKFNDLSARYVIFV